MAIALRNWCLSCFEDFADERSEIGMCYACEYEHDRSWSISRLPHAVINDAPTDWWGPTWSMDGTQTDVSGDDLLDGFMAVDENGTPIELLFDSLEELNV